jgi:Tfp pilus assembly protein PilP
MEKKRIVISSLIVLALLVWSHNVYRIITGVRQDDDEIAQEMEQSGWELPDSVVTSSKTIDPYVYQAKTRDPFKNWLQIRKPRQDRVALARGKPPVKQKKKVEIPPPALRFCGVLRDSSGFLAIIENPGGEVFFVRAKDEVAGVTILGIAQDRLDCRFRKRDFQLQLVDKNP